MPTVNTSQFAPDWKQWDRTEHHEKHGAEVAEVLGEDASAFDKWKYDAASKETVKRARLYFQAEHWEGRTMKDPLRAYFVDRHLLQGITNLEVQTFISYFPEACDHRLPLGDLRQMAEGDKLLRYKNSLFQKEHCEMYQKVTRIKWL